jgi:prolyl 4-hydroxylase
MAGDLREVDVLVGTGRRDEAIALLERLAEADEVPALLRLAEWRMFGTLVDKDVPEGRRLYERAARAGDPMASDFVTNFLASGTGGTRNWAKALKRLRREAERSPLRRSTLTALERMKLGPDGSSRALGKERSAHTNPDVQLFEGFLSPAETAYLIEVSERFMTPSVIFDVASGRNIPDPVRTSWQATFIPVFEDPAIHAINRRIAKASGVPVENGEPLQVLRYTAGQEFRRHVDATRGQRNMRAKTFLIWLNDGYTGGETVFTRLGVALRGRPGDAVVFDNVDANGDPDPRSEHAGHPVTAGTKYIASRWLCAAPYDLRA